MSASAAPDELSCIAIRNRAHQLWERDGQPIGKDLEHWLRAKEEHLYFITIGLGNEPTKEQLESALARVYKLRDFEIEHYWKRATYFWAFQVAIFAAFGLLLRTAETHMGDIIAVPLAALGILTAVANALSARGSRFWQKNWESHIDMLEDLTEGRLYKTIWLAKGKISFSVSRLNERLSDYFTIFWILIFIYICWRFLGSPTTLYLLEEKLDRHFYYIVFITVLTLIGGGLLRGQTSDFYGATPNHTAPTELKSSGCVDGPSSGYANA
jgi:hypothetical protein